MKQQSKIIAVAGMFAIIASIVVATSIEQAEAQGNPMVKSPKTFGQKTAGIVCGDRLCSDVESKIDIQDTPQLE